MNMLNNENYFAGLMMQTVMESFNRNSIALEPETANFVNNTLVKEYMDEYKGVQAW